MFDDDFYNRLSPALRRAYRQAAMSEDEDLKAFAHEMRQDLLTLLETESPLDQPSGGGILLGTTTSDEPNFPVGTPIHATLQECYSNIIIEGMTGSGKSEAASHLARVLTESKPGVSVEKQIHVVLYDVKGDHSPLALRKEWIWLPTRYNYKNRLTTPRGVPQYAYRESESEIFCVAHDLLNVGTNTLKAIEEIAEAKCRVVNKENDPTDYELAIAAHEFLDALPYKQKARFDVYARLLSRIADMIIGPYQECHRVRRGLTDEDTEDLNIVRDISDLSRARAIYEINHDLNRSFQRAKWNNLRGVAARPIGRIVEEATTLLNPRFVSRISNFDDIYKMGREFEQFSVLLVHSIILLPPICRNNTGVFLLMKNSSFDEIVAFADMTGMDQVHVELAQELNVGEAICKLSRDPRCVKIKVPYDPLDKHVDKELLERKVKDFLDPRMSQFVFVDPKEIAYAKSLIFKTDFGPRSAEKVAAQSKENLERNLKDLIVTIWKNQDEPYRSLRKAFRSTSSVDKAKDYGIENDYITAWTFSLDGEGRPPVYFGLQEKGRRVLIEMGHLRDVDPVHSVKGSPPQGIICRRLKKRYDERNLKAELEGYLNRADLSVYTEDGTPWLCYEVTVTQPIPKEIDNIKRDLSFGFHRIISLVMQFKEVSKNEFVYDKMGAENKAKKLHEEVLRQLPDEAPRVEVWTVENLRKMK
jgi:hypothetical protein